MARNADCHRVLLDNFCGEGLAYKLGDSESEDFWAEFNRCAQTKAYANPRE